MRYVEFIALGLPIGAFQVAEMVAGDFGFGVEQLRLSGGQLFVAADDAVKG